MDRSMVGTSQNTDAFDAQAMRENADEAAQMLKMLANAQRLRILCLLAEGEMSVGQINDRVDLSQSALSQHLARLRSQGLVGTRRNGQTIYYRLDNGPAEKLIFSLHEIFCAEPIGRKPSA